MTQKEIKEIEKLYKKSQLGSILPPWAMCVWDGVGVVVLGSSFGPHWLGWQNLTNTEVLEFKKFLKSNTKKVIGITNNAREV